MVRLAYAALILGAATASAGPVTVGASLGITQDEVNSKQDPNSTLSAFGRVAVTHRFGVVRPRRARRDQVPGGCRRDLAREADAVAVRFLGGAERAVRAIAR
jgi:hypothetical protein